MSTKKVSEQFKWGHYNGRYHGWGGRLVDAQIPIMPDIWSDDGLQRTMMSHHYAVGWLSGQCTRAPKASTVDWSDLGLHAEIAKVGLTHSFPCLANWVKSLPSMLRPGRSEGSSLFTSRLLAPQAQKSSDVASM